MNRGIYCIQIFKNDVIWFYVFVRAFRIPLGGMKWQRIGNVQTSDHSACAAIVERLCQYKSEWAWSLRSASRMPGSWVVAVNIGSTIKGFSLPCSSSSLLSANACICNVPAAALSPPATWIRCQPPVHGKALIWRQAGGGAKVGSRKKWPPKTPALISPTRIVDAQAHADCGNEDTVVDYPFVSDHNAESRSGAVNPATGTDEGGNNYSD